jgi:hypothetical protein
VSAIGWFVRGRDKKARDLCQMLRELSRRNAAADAAGRLRRDKGSEAAAAGAFRAILLPLFSIIREKVADTKPVIRQ